MNSPIVTFQSQSAPYAVISGINYVQSTLGGNNLPVKEGENSDRIIFRVYNNFGLASNIATMFNVKFTTFDGVGTGSHTATKSPVSQSWVRIYETGFGESTIAPGAYTEYIDVDTAIGRSGVDSYIPIYGSDGGSSPYIRAGADTNGVGFLELATYAQIPSGAGFADYTLAISIDYQWTT